MNDKQQIQIKALRERILLKEFLDMQSQVQQIIYTPYNGNDKFDATWVWMHPEYKAASRIIAEVKVREYPLTAYPGWLIEKDKYDYLMSRANDFEEVLYICFHSDGIQVWNLKQCSEPSWTLDVLPKTNQSAEVKVKIVGDLMCWDAVVIKKEIGIMTAIQYAADIYKERNNN